MDLHKLATEAGVPLHTNSTEIRYDDDARAAMTRAVAKINRAVSTTLGPFGMNAILDREGRPPIVTKDGVTVLMDLEFADQLEQTIYELFRAQAETISREVGDGTTSIVFLTAAMIELGHKYLANGTHLQKMMKGMRQACDAMQYVLREQLAIPAKNEEAIRAVLKTAANGEQEIVDTLTEVFLEVGDEGMIFVRDPRANHTQVIYEEGYVFPGKAATLELLPEDTGYLEWEDVQVLVVNDRITNPFDLVPIFEDILRRGKSKKLVLAFSEISDEALNLLHANNKSADVELKVIAFRMPLYADRQRGFLEDFAAFTDATIIDRRDGWTWKNIGVEQLGHMKFVNLGYSVVRCLGGRGKDTILPNGLSRLKDRLDFVKACRDGETANIDERNRLNERIAKLMGSVVAILPGGQSEPEMRRKRGVYEDAILAGQAAIKHGIVPGAGWGLWLAAEHLQTEECDDPEEEIGCQVVLQACKQLMTKLVQDSGRHVVHVVRDLTNQAIEANVKPEQLSIDLKTQKIGKLLDTGVVDPVLLHEVLLEQATSTAIMLLSAGAIITARPTEEYLKWQENKKYSALRA